MPRQNRVSPDGALVAVASRAATLMGNRGCLHDAHSRIVRSSARAAWVSCQLHFEGIQRQLMTPGHYTELFFLDEPTALASGHRPCFTCRRDFAKSFVAHYSRGNGVDGVAKLSDIDKQLRNKQVGVQQATRASVASLPDGSVVRAIASGQFFVLRRGGALPWSFDGYGQPLNVSTLGGDLALITPLGIVAALDDGYAPVFHPSAD